MKILTGRYLAEKLKRGNKILLEATVIETDRSKSPLKLSFDSTDYGRGDVWFSGDANFTVVEPPEKEDEKVSQDFANWVELAKGHIGSKWKSWCIKEISNMGWGAWLHHPDTYTEIEGDDGRHALWTYVVRDDQESHIRAILDGFVVKPKRWIIKNTDGDTCYLKRFRIGEDCIDGESSGWIGERVWAFTFTDRAKAEAVATLVEGSVEEV